MFCQRLSTFSSLNNLHMPAISSICLGSSGEKRLGLVSDSVSREAFLEIRGSLAYDMVRDKKQNLLEVSLYLNLEHRQRKSQILLAKEWLSETIHSCLRLSEDALVSVNLPCTSFVWINRGTHGRSSSRPLGNWAHQRYVREANEPLSCKLDWRPFWKVLLPSMTIAQSVLSSKDRQPHDAFIGLMRGKSLLLAHRAASSSQFIYYPHFLFLEKAMESIGFPCIRTFLPWS